MIAAVAAAPGRPPPPRFTDDDRPAHAGHGIGGPEVDDLARRHLLAGDRERDLAGLEIDRAAARDLGDDQLRPLPDGDQRLAAEQHLDERPITGGDPIL
jgi:hypothetical protein